jgi:hypothetical protein
MLRQSLPAQGNCLLLIIGPQLTDLDQLNLLL